MATVNVSTESYVHTSGWKVVVGDDVLFDFTDVLVIFNQKFETKKLVDMCLTKLLVKNNQIIGYV